MIKGHHNKDQNEVAASTAIRWFVRLRASDITELEYDLFFDWLFVAQINQQAFADTLRLWDSLEAVKNLHFDDISALSLLQQITGSTEASRPPYSRLSEI